MSMHTASPLTRRQRSEAAAFALVLFLVAVFVAVLVRDGDTAAAAAFGVGTAAVAAFAFLVYLFAPRWLADRGQALRSGTSRGRLIVLAVSASVLAASLFVMLRGA